MKFKDFLVPLSLALFVTWGLQYFLGSKVVEDGQVRSGQAFKAPDVQDIMKPLNYEVDFDDKLEVAVGEPIRIDLGFKNMVCRGTFTPQGGGVASLAFLHNQHELVPFSIQGNVQDREQVMLLSALDEQTPYAFKAVLENDEQTGVIFESASDHAIVVKKIFVPKNGLDGEIQVELTIDPKDKEKGAQARLFLPAPKQPELNFYEKVQALVYTDRGSIVKKSLQEVRGSFWYTPILFGAESKYFVHALVKDDNHFAQRGYFKESATGDLVAIIEGPRVFEKTAWKMSFYCGPKKAQYMKEVDARLLDTLDFGWLSFFAQLMLLLLGWLYVFLGNYGLAIIVLTILLKLLLWPLTIKSEQSMKKQAEFQKKMQYIEQKYKNDPDILARERMDMAKKFGFPAAGCLVPMLIQIPVLIGLNRVLGSSVELYKAPFFLWISDLSAKDPYYIFPMLASLGMVVQMANSPGSDSKKYVSTLLFALLIAAITANLSAGLTLFIAVNTWFGLLQTRVQQWIKSRA